MAVTSATPSITFTANGSTTDFAFNFVVPATDTTGTITDATADMSLGSAVLTVDTAGLFYTSDLQGKAITVTGAGVSSSDLTTTILSVDSATQITLNASASTAVTNTNISITTGTFNTTLKNNSDLLVFVDGTQQTITTDYTVRLNLGDDANKSGTVIFNSAPADGAKVVIIRDVTLERTTDFQTGGALTAKSLNAQFDNVIMAVQDTQFDTAASAIKFPSDETLSTTTLPAAASRGNKILGFNSSGEILMRDDVTTGNFAITGTTITATTGFVGNVTGDITGDITGNISGNVTGNITSTGTSTFSTVDINGGTIDNVIIGGSQQNHGSFTVVNTTDLTADGTITLNHLRYPTADGTNEQVLSTDGSGNLSFRSIAGLSLFTALTDTPSTYVGQDGKYLKVNESSSTIVFDTLTTDDVTEGANLYYTDARFDTRLATKDTGDLTEGTNLYYTDTRVDSRITGNWLVDEDNMASDSATKIPSQQSVKAYVDSQVTAQDLDATTDSGTIDIDLDSETLTVAGGEGIDTSATGTTITISGEDASTSNKGIASFDANHFSVTAGAVSIGTDSIDDTLIDFGTGAGQVNTDDLPEGSTNEYFTNARARASVSVQDNGGDGSLGYNSTTGVITYTGPSAAEVRAHISVTDTGGDGSLAYNSSTGVITYTGPSASEVRAHFTGGTGISITNGDVALDFSEFSTTNITEGTNLYYTDARAQAVSINNVVEDTSPQLGGDLDVNGQKITTTSNGNIVLAPNGTGELRVDAGTEMYNTGALLIHNGSQGDYLDLTGAGATLGPVYGTGVAVEAFNASPTLTMFAHKANLSSQYPNIWTARSRDDGAGNKDFLNNNDKIFGFFGAGWDQVSGGDGTFAQTAVVELRASEDHSNTAGGGKVVIGTTNRGTTPAYNAATDKLTIADNVELNTDLDVNGQNIVSTSNGNINIEPNGTGVTNIKSVKVINNGGINVQANAYGNIILAGRDGTDIKSYSLEVQSNAGSTGLVAGNPAGSFGLAGYADSGNTAGSSTYAYLGNVVGVLGDASGGLASGFTGDSNHGIRMGIFKNGITDFSTWYNAATFRSTNADFMQEKLKFSYSNNTVFIDTAGGVSDKIAFKNRTIGIGRNDLDDSTDKGFEIKYVDSGAKVAFLGYDDSTGKITYIPDSTNTSGVFSGTVGAFDLSGTPIGDLSNVDLSGTLTVGHFLKWDGTNFVLGENPLATMGADLNTGGYIIKADGAYGVGVSTANEGDHNLKLHAGYLDGGAGQQEKPGDVEIKHARSIRIELEHIDPGGQQLTWGRDKPAEIIFGQNHTDGYFDATKNTTPNNALDYSQGDAKITMRSSAYNSTTQAYSKYGGLITTEFFKGNHDDDTTFGNDTDQNSGLGGERSELQKPYANDMVLSAFPLGSYYYNVNSGSSFSTVASDEPFDRDQNNDVDMWATYTGIGSRYAYTPEGRVVVRTARRTGEEWDDGSSTRYQIRNENVVSFGVPESLADDGNQYWDVDDSTNQAANGGLTNLKNRTPVAEFHVPVVLEKLGDFAITAASKAAIIDASEADGSPHQDIVLTVPGHNFAVGEIIEINDVGGMTQLNGNQYIVADLGYDGTDKFRLRQYPTNVKQMVNGNGFSTYTSGGTIRKVRGNLTEGSLAYDTVKDNFIIHNGTVWGDVHTSLKPSVLANLTTTERNALTGVAGMTIFNTTESRIEYHDGSGWKYISGTAV